MDWPMLLVLTAIVGIPLAVFVLMGGKEPEE